MSDDGRWLYYDTGVFTAGSSLHRMWARVGLPPTPVTAGSVIELPVAGRGGVPVDASAAVLNVTVTDAQGAGFVTVFPCGQPRPLASTLNYVTGSTVANAAITKIGDGGKVCLLTSAATHLIADVTGYFPSGATYVALQPDRFLDTRVPIP